MIPKTLILATIGSLALLTHQSGNPVSNQVANTQLPETDLATDENPNSAANKEKASKANPLLKVYALRHADSREVTKTLNALQLADAKIVNDESKAKRIHVLATEPQHTRIQELISKLDVQSGDAVAEKPATATPKRRFKIKVALVKNDWTKQLFENRQLEDELQKLYADVDVSAIGNTLNKAAPTLLFPTYRAALFSSKEIESLIACLKQMKLLKEVPAIESGVETHRNYFIENFQLEGLSVWPSPNRAYANLGPFSKTKGIWSVALGLDPTREDTVICLREFAEYIETEWPTRTNSVDRTKMGSRRYGNRLKMRQDEVAVVRWSMGPPSSTGITSFGGIAKPSGGQTDETNRSFPILIISHASNAVDAEDAEPRWSKPQRTTAVDDFNYRIFDQFTPRNSSRSRGLNTANGSIRRGEMFGSTAAAAETKPAATDDSKSKKEKFVIYPVKQFPADNAIKLIEPLFSNNTPIRISVDVRTNSLLVSAPEEQHRQFSDILTVLDVPAVESNSFKDRDSSKPDMKSVQMEMGPEDLMILKGSKESVAAAENLLNQMSSSQLNRRSQALSDEAIARATEYLSSGAAKKSFDELKKTVLEDFEVRQRLQLAEIEFLKARLADLERRVRQKEQLKDRIVDRRIEELLSNQSHRNEKTDGSVSKDLEPARSKIRK